MYVLTAPPKTGKSTAIKKIINMLGSKNCCGFYTKEMIENEQRVGFKIVTLSGKEGILAHVFYDGEYRIGKYGVNLEEFEKVALTELENIINTGGDKYVIIDEIGPMQLFSDKYKELLLKIVSTDRKIIGTAFYESYDWLDDFKKLDNVELIELALKSILTRNSMIFVSEKNYMDFTNRLILILIKNILDKYGIDKNLIQLLYTDNFHALLSNNVSINRVLAIGDLEFQNRVKESSSVELICLGIDRYDIYIEDINNISILEALSKMDSCDIYVKSGLQVSFDDYIEVKDIEEAVGEINFNSAGYTSIILTDSKSSASYFVKNVKVDNVFVNTLFTQNYLKFDMDLFFRKKKVIDNIGMMNSLFGGSYE